MKQAIFKYSADQDEMLNFFHSISEQVFSIVVHCAFAEFNRGFW